MRTAQPIPFTSPTFLPHGTPTYNEELNTCDITGTPHCELWDIDEPFPIRFQPAELGEDLIDCTPVLSFTAASGSDATTLVRPTGNFSNDDNRRLVHNVTTGETACIVSHVTDTATTVGGGFSPGDSVRIYKFRLSVATQVSGVSFVNGRGANEPRLSFLNFVGRINWQSDNTGTFGVNPVYRFSIRVASYQSGLLEVLGFTTTAPASQAEVVEGNIQAAGDLEYLLVLGGGLSPALDADVSSAFTGEIDMCAELFKIRTSYYYAINGNFVPFSAAIFGMPIMAETFITPSEAEGIEPCRNQICVYTDVEGAECAVFQEVTAWLTYPGGSGTDSCIDSEKDDIIQGAELPCALVDGATYDFILEVDGTGAIEILIADALVGNQSVSPAFAMPGTYQFSLTVNMPPMVAAFLYARAAMSPTEGCFRLYMKRQGAEIHGEPFMCSECYDFKPLDQCNMKLEWLNNTGAFGLVPLTIQNAYPPARLRNSKIEHIDFEEGKGVDSMQRSFYANGRRVEELSVAIVPPFVHEYLSVAMMHRTFKINGVEYVALEQYNPDYSDDHEAARAIVKVAQRNQKFLVNPL
jgi:hypothetical protein